MKTILYRPKRVFRRQSVSDQASAHGPQLGILHFFYKNDFAQSLLIIASYFLLWALAVSMSFYGEGYSFAKAFTYAAWKNIYVGLTCLLIFHVLIKAVKTSRQKTWVIIGCVLLVAAVLTVVFWEWLKLGTFFSLYPYEEQPVLDLGYMVRTVVFQLYSIGYFALIKLLIRFILLRFRAQQLQIEKKQSELNYLKSQTNPHFLFNTLNNIYSLSRSRSEATSESILRLSDMLRYMLYETQVDWVPVSKEIRVMNDYLELEKIRYDETLRINWKTELDNPDQQIPPLLMLPLLENAFKHGVSETDADPFIDISLRVEEEVLHFKVINSVGENFADGEQREGIGLKNIRRQLQLLFSESNLWIESSAEWFKVEMMINLKTYAKDQMYNSGR